MADAAGGAGRAGGVDLDGLDAAGLAGLAAAALARLDADALEDVVGAAAGALADPDGQLATAGRMVERLAGAALGGELSDVALGASVADLERLERRVHAEKLRRVAAAAERAAHAGRARSTPDWLAGPLGLSPAEAKTLTDTAVALGRLPATAARLAAGDLGVGQAAAAAAALADLDTASDADAAEGDAVAGLDGFVATQSPTLTRHELRTRIDAWQEASSWDVLAERTRRAHRSRRAYLHRHRDGSVRFGGRLDPAGGAHLAAALDALARRGNRDDERTPAQRRADAFVDLARRSLDAGGLPDMAANAPHVIVITPADHVHATPDTTTTTGGGGGGGGVRGGAAGGPHDPDGAGAGRVGADRAFPGGLPAESWLDGYGPVPSATARMFACHGQVSEVVVDEHGLPLQVRELGKPTLRQRRAVIARDRTCIGCGAPASRCQVHHIVWRRNNGATVVDNLTLVCANCHHSLHHDGWTIVRARNGHHTIHRPSPFGPDPGGEPATMPAAGTPRTPPSPTPGR